MSATRWGAQAGFSRLTASGNRPTIASYHVFVEKLAADGNHEALRHLLHQADLDGTPLDKTLALALVSACANAKPAAAWEAEEAFRAAEPLLRDESRALKALAKAVGPNRFETLSKELDLKPVSSWDRKRKSDKSTEGPVARFTIARARSLDSSPAGVVRASEKAPTLQRVGAEVPKFIVKETTPALHKRTARKMHLRDSDPAVMFAIKKRPQSHDTPTFPFSPGYRRCVRMESRSIKSGSTSVDSIQQACLFSHFVRSKPHPRTHPDVSVHINTTPTHRILTLVLLSIRFHPFPVVNLGNFPHCPEFYNSPSRVAWQLCSSCAHV